MARNRRQYDSLLKRMAESMRLMIVSVLAKGKRPATWHIAKRHGGFVSRLTISYSSPEELLDEFLNRYDVINTEIGKKVWNPFYGMSPEEVELRLAVIGA